jgi:putative sterol carrier protein
MKLASLEYMQEATERVNGDAKYLELAKGNNESYTLVLEPEPEKGVTEQIVVGFQNADGKMAQSWREQRPTDFTLTAPYGVWVDILRGKIGPTKALTMRKLKSEGSFVKLVQGATRITRWVEILRTIPTEFEGEYAQYNLPGE